MELSEFGAVIKSYREQYQVSREELSTPDLDPITLFRVEEGDETPTKKILSEVFGALGMGLPINLLEASNGEYERYLAQEKILEQTARQNYESLDCLTKAYKDALPEMNRFELQFYHLYKGIYFLMFEENYFQAIEEFRKSLLSVGIDSDCDFHTLLKMFITQSVMDCIKWLSIAEYRFGKKDKAIEQMNFIVRYIEKGRCAQLSEHEFFLIALYNLCLWYIECENYLLANETAQKGIRACIKYGSIIFFAQFNSLQGKAENASGVVEGDAKSKLWNEFIDRWELYVSEEQFCLINKNAFSSEATNVWDDSRFKTMQPSSLPIVCRLLRDIRKQKKLTLDDVCRGVCTKTTLSRMETGIIRPNLNQLRIFFSRMGVKTPKQLISVTKWEKSRYDIESLMNRLWRNDDHNFTSLLDEYFNVRPKISKLEMQVYLFNKAISESIKGKGREESIKICREALSLTQTDEYDFLNNKSQRLSYVERNLINFIAHCEYYLFEADGSRDDLKKDAFFKEYSLKEYHEKYIDGFKNIRLYTAILFNLTNWTGLDGKYDEALGYVNESLVTCFSCNSLQYFAAQIYNKAYTYLSQEQYGEALDLLFDFVLISKNTGDMLEGTDVYLNDIKTYLNYDLPAEFIEKINGIPRLNCKNNKKL